MIKRIFSKKINSVTAAAFLVAFSSLVSRLLGVFRDRILASEFGAGDALDAYYAAFRVPDFIFNLLVLGALSAGFIPIFSKIIKSPKEKIKNAISKKKYEDAWIFANNILNILGISLIILSFLGIIFAPYLMKWIAPGFNGEKLEQTIILTRLMFLSPIFLGVSSVFGGILQSFKMFFVYSLSPIVYNLGIIIGALFLAPIYGVLGLAIGVVIGAFLHMAIQVPLLFKLGYRYKLIFNLADKNTRKIFKIMIPRTMSLGLQQVNLLVITIIASTLASGSLTVFNFANNLQYFPIGIFGISFAVAVFPALSASAFDTKKLIKNFSGTFRNILFFIVPSTVLFIILRAQIIRIILGAGKFDWEDTIMTMSTLGFFAISLFAQATIPLLIRVFYARENSRVPFLIGLAVFVINVALSLYFAGSLGVAGLALAFSISAIIQFILLWMVLHIELGDMDEEKILISTIKFSIAGLGCGIVAQGMKTVVWDYIDMTRFWGVFIQGAVSAIAGLLVYFIICYLLRSEEFSGFLNSVLKRFSAKKVEVGDQGEARGI